jgi:hypothetical protein
VRETRIRTEHERVGIQRGEGDEQAAKAAPYVRELWPFSGCGKGGVVRAPVDVIGGGWVLEVVVGEGVRVGALPVVPFLQM